MEDSTLRSSVTCCICLEREQEELRDLLEDIEASLDDMQVLLEKAKHLVDPDFLATVALRVQALSEGLYEGRLTETKRPR